MNEKGKYNMKAFSKMVGIQPGTIRAWERRYSFLKPQRNSLGHRLYSDLDVEQMKWIQNQLDVGITIGQAIELLGNEHQTSLYNPKIADEFSSVQTMLHETMNELMRFRIHTAERIFQPFLHHFIDDDFRWTYFSKLEELINLKLMGENSHKVQKEFVLSFFSRKIHQVSNLFLIQTPFPKVLVICNEEYIDELHLSAIFLHLRKHQFEVVVVEAGYSVRDVELLIKETEASVLIMSLGSQIINKKSLTLVRQLQVLSGITIAVVTSNIRLSKQPEGLLKNVQLIRHNKRDTENWMKALILNK
ncbi:MerR family transcriptional regulator [Alkalihalobacillus trypoxylicola]|uniref:HTH merR-type domain-containing protein n=1 Tax=Alkalihalobacillus trypoxylicola TaxID=519424 RepID=A0A161PIN4_9BACI|nr:MerR family transcriptional regulator [Alkalihalobacillus trypoxylicola]KYG33132.1 hypothetical protein AZF04_17450 [Alkalihalobacillus trypoxylicola]